LLIPVSRWIGRDQHITVFFFFRIVYSLIKLFVHTKGDGDHQVKLGKFVFRGFFGLASLQRADVRTDGASGRSSLQSVSRATPNVISIEKEGEGAADAQPVSGGGGDTETKQQKARREMQHPIYF
jgi:hypothetical protein